jgi:hypothetical protein
MQIRSECLLSPDKAYGRIAWNNRAKICNFDPIDNSLTVIVSESAALWRGSGLDIYQRSHADGESGQFNIVEPLTNGYVVRVLLPGRLGLNRVSLLSSYPIDKKYNYWRSSLKGLIVGVKFAQRGLSPGREVCEKITLKS